MNNFLIGTIAAGAIAGLALDLSGNKHLKKKFFFKQEIPFTLIGIALGLFTGVVADSGMVNGIGSVLQYHPRCASIIIFPLAAYFGWDKIPSM